MMFFQRYRRVESPVFPFHNERDFWDFFNSRQETRWTISPHLVYLMALFFSIIKKTKTFLAALFIKPHFQSQVFPLENEDSFHDFFNPREQGINLDLLPIELFVYLFDFQTTKSLINLSGTCKTYRDLIRGESRIWREKIRPFQCICKEEELYQTYVYNRMNFHWNRDPNLESIKINGREVSRENGDSNPVVTTILPLSPFRPEISFKIEEIGTWIGVGVVDSKIKRNHSYTLCHQRGKFIATWFCQDRNVIRYTSLSSDNGRVLWTRTNMKRFAPEIRKNSVITVSLDYAKGSVYFTDGTFFGVISTRLDLSRYILFPCVTLSQDSRVSIV